MCGESVENKWTPKQRGKQCVIADNKVLLLTTPTTPNTHVGDNVGVGVVFMTYGFFALFWFIYNNNVYKYKLIYGFPQYYNLNKHGFSPSI